MQGLCRPVSSSQPGASLCRPLCLFNCPHTRSMYLHPIHHHAPIAMLSGHGTTILTNIGPYWGPKSCLSPRSPKCYPSKCRQACSLKHQQACPGPCHQHYVSHCEQAPVTGPVTNPWFGPIGSLEAYVPLHKTRDMIVHNPHWQTDSNTKGVQTPFTLKLGVCCA